MSPAVHVACGTCRLLYMTCCMSPGAHVTSCTCHLVYMSPVVHVTCCTWHAACHLLYMTCCMSPVIHVICCTWHVACHLLYTSPGVHVTCCTWHMLYISTVVHDTWCTCHAVWCWFSDMLTECSMRETLCTIGHGWVVQVELTTAWHCPCNYVHLTKAASPFMCLPGVSVTSANQFNIVLV